MFDSAGVEESTQTACVIEEVCEFDCGVIGIHVVSRQEAERLMSETSSDGFSFRFACWNLLE